MAACVQTPAGAKGEGHLDIRVKKNILRRGQQGRSPKAGLYLVCGKSSEETSVAGSGRTRRLGAEVMGEERRSRSQRTLLTMVPILGLLFWEYEKQCLG